MSDECRRCGNPWRDHDAALGAPCPPRAALPTGVGVPDSSQMCKCGDPASRHEPTGKGPCTWNPDCLCMKFEAAGVGVPPDEDLVARSAKDADARGRAQRVIDQAMESSGPPAAGTPERVLWDTAVDLARDVIALTDKVYDRGSDALVNDVEPEGAAAGDPPSREDARSLHDSGDRRLATGPGSLARREIFPPDSAVAPAGVGEARPAEPEPDCGCAYELVEDGAVQRKRWFHEPGCPVTLPAGREPGDTRGTPEVGSVWGGCGMTCRVLAVWDDDVRVLRLTSVRGGLLKRPRETGVIPRKHFAEGGRMHPTSLPPSRVSAQSAERATNSQAGAGG